MNVKKDGVSWKMELVESSCYAHALENWLATGANLLQVVNITNLILLALK